MPSDSRPVAASPAQVPLADFVWDENARVFVHPAYAGFAYSDGDATEARIYEILRRTEDVGLFSETLQAQITDWATEYHFSERRHNLLRHLPIKSGQRVLELGAGCGAITRQFGESGAEVVAVEGSKLRARCVAERCRDLGNVRVYCSDFQQIEFGERFDVVTLIGVLEYSGLFFRGDDPFGACLALARSALKPDGVLLVAIENRLGLKYFLGLSEDHVGKPYFGLEDLYTRQTAQTFGREELAVLLRRCGFKNLTFHYPFPDYKLPTAVLIERAFHTAGFAPGEIVRQTLARDYTRALPPTASERHIWPELAANGLIPALANSFLVLAGSDRLPDWAAADAPLLGVVYAPRRQRRYKTETRFSVLANGAIEVTKRRLVSQVGETDATEETAAEANATVRQVLDADAYVAGAHFESELMKRLRQNDTEGFLAGLRLWRDFVQSEGVEASDSTRIRPEFFDCTPRNLILHDDRLAYIDREWRFLPPCSVSALLTRGLFYFLGANLPYVAERDTTLGALLTEWMASLEVQLDDALLAEFMAVETAFNQVVHGNGKQIPAHIRRHLRWSRRDLNAETRLLARANRLARRQLKAVYLRLKR